MKGPIKSYSIVFVSLLTMSCLHDDGFKQVYQGYSPVDRKYEWVVSSPAAENMDADLIDQAYQLIYRDNRFTMARSLLVVRHGMLVAEAYPNDPQDIDRIANIQSMTKSFTSILTGIALDKGVLDSVNQPLVSIYPEYFTSYPEKKGITLRHALTMTTGIYFDNGVHTQGLYETEDDPLDFVLSRKQEYTPGIVFRYHDGAPQLISGAIQKRTGENLAAFAKQQLFDPLGITDWKWEESKDQSTFGAFSLFLRPRDLARFGQLLLQHGKWGSQRVVDSTWIANASSVQVNSGTLGAPYGYYFWIYPAYKAFAADGHGGQRLMVFPEKDLVIVYTAWGYTSGEFFDNLNEAADLIAASCR